MRKWTTIFAVVLLVMGLGACKKQNDKHDLAVKYFSSNVEAYGLFSEMGIESVEQIANSVSDEEFAKQAGAIAGSCSRPVFMSYVKESHLAMNKVITKFALQEIEKTFSDEELAEMTKVYSSVYDAEMMAKIKSFYTSKDFVAEMQKAASGKFMTKEKLEIIKKYKTSELGKKETAFTRTLWSERLKAHESEIKNVEKPKEPECLKPQAAGAGK